LIKKQDFGKWSVFAVEDYQSNSAAKGVEICIIQCVHSMKHEVKRFLMTNRDESWFWTTA